MTTDFYAILGVSPGAEDVVIRAAYRALMRLYHPDTNSDPDAQARARAITAAYSVLRDPTKRAEYDAERSAGDLWAPADDEEFPRQPPAMRTVGIASALLALVLVGAVWTLAEKAPPPASAGKTEPARQGRAEGLPDVVYNAAPLEPESERLARLRDEAEILSPAPPLDEVAPPDPVLTAEPSTRPPAVAPIRTPGAAARRPTSQPVQPPVISRPTSNRPETRNGERLATLDTMASGFLAQSLAHASDAKKELLLGARNRSAAKRKACASDSCTADAYVRQIRETSAIMEGRAGPPK